MSAFEETVLRLSLFSAIFVILALWEWFAPRRRLTVSKSQRWLNNLLIIMLDNVILRVVFPVTVLSAALFAEQQQWGILHYFSVPSGWAVVLAFVALDAIIYFQHVLFHAVPILWRCHRVHHADQDIDVTTGVRFHPFEMVLSLFIKCGAIIVLGAPPLAVFLFEVILNGTSLFNHSNVQLPMRVDKFLRWIIVTPDMHRVHHSVVSVETNSNFGFNFPWWDRLMKTYRAQPQAGHRDMTIGLRQCRSARFTINLFGMLWLPFVNRLS